MTTLREAATQALEALEDFGMKHYENTGEVLHRDVYESLKAALVEDAMQKFTDVNQELEAALAEPVQEPVIDRRLVLQAIDDLNMVDDVLETHWVEHDVGTGRVNEVLCSVLKAIDLAPPQRVPLTREEAIALWADKSDGPSNGEIVSYCRAIERAHGIT